MINLILGDCLDIMPELPAQSIDAIIADIPYGTTACKWDVIIPFDKMWSNLARLIKPNGAIVLFGSEPFSSLLRASNLKWYRYDLYWKKERITNVFQVKRRVGKIIETISIFYKNQCTYNPQMVENKDGKLRDKATKNGRMGKLLDNQSKQMIRYIRDDRYRYPTQVLEFSRDNVTNSFHETQKPVALMEYLIRTYTNEGETVLDFTMGSGSTGVAAKNTNRSFIGIEKEQKYFDIAKERIYDT